MCTDDRMTLGTGLAATLAVVARWGLHVFYSKEPTRVP